MEEEKVYRAAKSYWEAVPSTVHGMLGGFTQINSIDLSSSSRFLRKFCQGTSPLLQCRRAVDCGSGIGRVTKSVLLPLFETVDMVDVNQEFLDKAKIHLGNESSRVDRFICSSLHMFDPEPGRYDAVWCQWVLCQLSNDDLVAFFRRCKAGLTEDGLIFFKENMGSSDELVFDETDSTWIRPRRIWLQLVNEAGLKIVGEEKQKSFPKDLYDVHMFAIH